MTAPLTIQAVTTCHLDLYALTGARMIDCFLEYWPQTIELALFAEGFTPNPDPRIIPCRLPLWLEAFKCRHAADTRAHGRGAGAYNYRFDAVKFAHKTAAVISAAQAGRRTGIDRLIWMDADIVTHATVTADFLDRMIAPNAAIAWLDRARLYPECGFYVLNLSHPRLPALLDAWRALYETDSLFGLPEWHDSFVLEHLVKLFSLPATSLSGHARGTLHPFVNGPLGAFMDHLKGNRKIRGGTSLPDLIQPRSEPYWEQP